MSTAYSVSVPAHAQHPALLPSCTPCRSCSAANQVGPALPLNPVVALAFYGVNEIGRCMEDPFSWDEPCHDLSGAGWRIYRENLQIPKRTRRTPKTTNDSTETDTRPSGFEPRAIDQPAAKNRRLSKGARVSAADLFRRAVVRRAARRGGVARERRRGGVRARRSRRRGG